MRLAQNCHMRYTKASPETRKLWNRAFFEKILVKDGKVIRSIYAEPFFSVLGSHKGSLVEVSGHYSKRFPALRALVDGGAA